MYEWIYTDLTHCGLLLTQSHNDDTVSLTDAALGPRCEAGVRLVEDNAMDVFLLAKPTGQTILMDALRDEAQTCHWIKVGSTNKKMTEINFNYSHNLFQLSTCPEQQNPVAALWCHWSRVEWDL